MNDWLQLSERLAETWAGAMWRASWQGAIAITIVLIACKVMRSAPAWTKCWLWRLIDIKLLAAIALLSPICVPLLPATKLSDRIRPALETSGDGTRLDTTVPVGQGFLTVELNDPAVLQHSAVEMSATSFGVQLFAVLSCFLLWLCGVLIGFVSLGWQWFQTTRIQRDAITTPWLLDTIRELSAEYGLRDSPRIASSPDVAVPLLMGMWRPTVVLPEGTLRDESRQQLRLILSHEIGHVRRGDLWWSCLPAVVQILFFFHPLVWLAHRQWRLSREMACDELAIVRFGSRVSDYASALLQVAVNGSEHLRARRSFGIVSVSESTTSLKRRFVAMRYLSEPSRARTAGYVAVLVGITILGVVPWRPVAQANEPDPPKAETKQTPDPSFGANMGFELQKGDSRPESWYGGGKGYTLTLDGAVKHSGDLSGKIESIKDGVFGTYTQCGAANALRGKRVSYKGFLKTDIEDGHAGLWMRVDGPGNKVLGFDNMSRRSIKGTTDWKEYEVVLDVPKSATGICFGFLLHGQGTIWGDDLKILAVEDAGKGTKTTGMPTSSLTIPTSPVNTDFEIKHASKNIPQGWGGGGQGYELTRDTNEAHGGTASGRIEQTDADGTFGTFTQMFAAKDYLGKRIKYTGFLKTNEANAAGLWFRVDGETKPVSFDNMQTRPVRGTTDWTEYEVVLDVPDEATQIAYGFLLIGGGTIWGDDLKVEILGPAGEGPATTGTPLR